MNRPCKSLAILLAGVCLSAGTASADINVSAAASLTKALTDIAKGYEQAHKTPVKLSFAASSALAKQIEQGAPADLFISADTQWMDHLDKQGKIDAGSRVNLLGNALVLVAPAGQGFPVTMTSGFDFAHAFDGMLCTGVVESVPVGIYAKEALTHLGWWKGIQSRVVGTEDVRAALDLVEQGECAAGIVYETDAKPSTKVKILGRFPADSHSPIVYPAALVGQTGAARDFLAYLHGKQAAAVFVKYGFTLLGN